MVKSFFGRGRVLEKSYNRAARVSRIRSSRQNLQKVRK
jgi:hypothetical protein